MAWKVNAVGQQRVRFVVRASETGSNLSQLCREFEISRPTGYLWLKRWQAEKRSPWNWSTIRHARASEPGKIPAPAAKSAATCKPVSGSPNHVLFALFTAWCAR